MYMSFSSLPLCINAVLYLDRVIAVCEFYLLGDKMITIFVIHVFIINKMVCLYRREFPINAHHRL